MPIWIRTAAQIRLKLEADIHVQGSKPSVTTILGAARKIIKNRTDHN